MIVLIKNVLKFLHYHTYREFLKRLGRVAVKPLYESIDRYIVKLDLQSVAEPDPDLEIKELTTDNIDKMLEVMYVSRVGLQERFFHGDRCFAVLDNGKIVSYFWAQFGLKNCDELHLKFNLLPNQAWMYNAVTIKTARGRGLYPNIIRYMAKVLLQSGIDESFVDVDPKNHPSIRGLEKAGCTRVALIRMKKVLSKTTYKLAIFDGDVWCQLSKMIENFDSKRFMENRR